MTLCISVLRQAAIIKHFQCKVYNYATFRIADIYKTRPIDSFTEVKGWVRNMRKMKDFVFVDVDDGSCSKRLQVVIPKSSVIDNLSYGCSVEVTGHLVSNPNNQLEIKAETVKVVGSHDVNDYVYPFLPRKSYSPTYMRQYLHFRNRTNTFGCFLRVRAAAAEAFRQSLCESGFVEIHTPIITSNDCEGAGEVFIAKPSNENVIKSMAKEGFNPEEAYFDTKAYLTVSGQLHLEAAVRSLSKVYTFGPTFRAENSKSRLHLSEFYMLEAEFAFVEKFEDLLLVIEKLLKDVTKKILDKCEDDIAFLLKSNSENENTGLTLGQLCDKKFGVMNYDEAVKILSEHAEQFASPICPGENLGKEHELFLVKHNGGCPVFVVNWPQHIKPFYMKQVENDSNKVYAVDLLYPVVGELCGGSLREDNVDILEERLKGLNQDKLLSWYLEIRKFGNVPTAGFGIGFERYLQSTLNITNIKDAIPFPRWPHNCKM